MKINKIELENLNSVKGKWTIDFTHPDYKKWHNQFVISGDTGSGKSTILDAITLALYGKTPRLGGFTKNQNEIMTRKTEFCLAAVTFECTRGNFRCEFSQRKTRNGTLADTNSKIENLDSGELLWSGRSNLIEEHTKELISLDYEQFLKSILLAQGEFDSFIKSEGNPQDVIRKRAEILAKLNGTEKYREIGEKVHLKAKKYEEDFKLLEKEFEILNKDLLSDEQKTEIEEETADLEKQQEKLKKSQKENQENLNWIKSFEEISDEYEDLQKAKKELEQKKKDFEEKKGIFEKAVKAKNCEASYNSYKTLKNQWDSDKKDLDTGSKNCQEAEKKSGEAENLKKEAFSILEEQTKKLEESRKLWNTVRSLDKEIENLSAAKEKSLERKEKAEEEVEEVSAKLEENQKQLKNLQTQHEKLEKELAENEKDKNLGEALIKAEQKILLVKENCSLKAKLENQQKEKFAEETELEKHLQNIKAEKEKVEKELKEFVNSKYKLIANILRNNLKAEAPCPVCGSVEHPFCTANPDKEIKESDADSAVAKMQLLSEESEKLEKELSEAEKILAGSRKDIENLEAQLKALEEKQKLLLKDINGLLNDWKILADENTSSAEFDQLLENLQKRSEAFKNQRELKEKTEKLISEKQIGIENDKNNLDSAKVKLLAEEKELGEAEKNLEEKTSERSKKFGSKKVDEEEENLTAQVEVTKADYDEKTELCVNLKTEISAQKARCSQLEKNLSENKPKLEAAEEKFRENLSKNGFNSQEEYAQSNLDEKEFEQLSELSEELKKAETEIKANLASAEKRFAECKAQKKTEKNKTELEVEQKTLEEKFSLLGEKIGGNKKLLQTDCAKKEEIAAKQKEYDALSGTVAKWRMMKEFVGKATGEDLEVFVQGIAFKYLLEKASVYLFAISGKYTLVQCNQTVDCLVRDVNFPNPKDDRPISAMSGGEKFIISLSLALGIAELASENVRVDCLFLDEGFGTLSGQPLTEAINALKQLQGSGKMLGIITHIPAVIEEFPQKIQLKQVPGGYSEISGSGISRN